MADRGGGVERLGGLAGGASELGAGGDSKGRGDDLHRRGKRRRHSLGHEVT